MLKDNFYKVVQIDVTGSATKAELELNAGHAIFEGHFPGTPVVPGVCMMQIVKELAEANAGRPLQIAGAESMKFLSVIDPVVDKMMHIELSTKDTGAGMEVVAVISAGSRVCFKFKGGLIYL